MERSSKDIHSIFGDLANALKRCTIPKPSIVIDDKYLKLAEQLHNDNENSDNGLPPRPVQACSIPKSSERPVITLSTPHILPTHLHVLPTHQNESSQPLQFETVQSSENDLLLEPESLLKLLADDSEITPNVFEYGLDTTNNHTLQCSNNVTLDAANNYLAESDKNKLHCSTGPPSVQPTMLRIPEYLKVPARIFPVIIGNESYLLPYKDNSLTVVVAFNVILAAGEYVVAKIMGCGAYQPDVSYPEGIILTEDDEIKAISAKGPAEMTIDEQMKYHAMKEKQNLMLANQIEKYNLQQQRHLLQQQRADVQATISEHSKSTPKPKQKCRFTKPKATYAQYLSISSGLVGTIVKIPNNEHPDTTDDNHGLISYEINDGFATVPFYSMTIPMIGGETVEFDLNLNCEMKKCEAVRIRLAPLNANLKNSAVCRTMKQKRKSVMQSKDLPLIKSPPSTYYTDKVKKCGLYGKIHSLPSKHRDGIVKYLIGNAVARAVYRDLPHHDNAKSLLGCTVRFDLHIWFDTGNPSEAVNIKITKDDSMFGRYSVVDFICDGLPDDKEWTVEDFRQLMVVLKEGKKEYDWRLMSLQMNRSQSNIKNFLKIFVSHISSVVNPSVKHSYTKADLDRFVDSISCRRKPPVSEEETSSQKKKKRNRKPSTKENNGIVGVNGKKPTKPAPRPRKPSAKENTAVAPSPKPGPKRPKKSTIEAASADCISKQEALPELTLPTNFTPHQTFVAKNLHHWQQVREVPGERAVNSVLGDVMLSCSKYTGTSSKASKLGNQTPEHINYTSIYQYLGALLRGEQEELGVMKLSSNESQVLLYLMQDLFEDIAKRNLHTHKQFLLQRFFDFTGGKTTTRTPINPYKLKGFLLHLPEPLPTAD